MNSIAKNDKYSLSQLSFFAGAFFFILGFCLLILLPDEFNLLAKMVVAGIYWIIGAVFVGTSFITKSISELKEVVYTKDKCV